MSFVPYIHFQGNCAAALTWYAEVFGATNLVLMPYGEMPDAPADMPGRDLVMHGQITLNGQDLMASDFPPGQAGDPQQAVSIHHHTATVEEGRAIYDRLMEGGAPIMPYEATFFAKGFGMLKDRFGTHWMISGPWEQPG